MLRNQSPQQLLEHPVRATIVDEVRRRPGVSFLALSESVLTISGRSLGGYGTVSHHLYQLERARLVVSRPAGRHRRFFIPQHARAAPRLSVLWDPLAQQVMDVLRANPGLDQTRIAETMGRPRPNIYRLLARLHEAGLIRRARHGRALQCWPTPHPHKVAQSTFPTLLSQGANRRATTAPYGLVPIHSGTHTPLRGPTILIGARVAPPPRAPLPVLPSQDGHDR